MDSLGCLAVGLVVTLRIGEVKDADITEGDIAGSHVEGAKKVLVDGLIAVHMHVILRIEALQHKTCQQVFLEGRHLHIGVITPEGFHKRAFAGRGVKEARHGDASLLHALAESLYDRHRRIERTQHGGLDAADIPLVLLLILAVLHNELMERQHVLHERLVTLHPCLRLRAERTQLLIVGDRVQDELKTAEAAVLQQGLALLLATITTLTHLEGHADGLDVILQLLTFVVSHSYLVLSISSVTIIICEDHGRLHVPLHWQGHASPPKSHSPMPYSLHPSAHGPYRAAARRTPHGTVPYIHPHRYSWRPA